MKHLILRYRQEESWFYYWISVSQGLSEVKMEKFGLV